MRIGIGRALSTAGLLGKAIVRYLNLPVEKFEGMLAIAAIPTEAAWRAVTASMDANIYRSRRRWAFLLSGHDPQARLIIRRRCGPPLAVLTSDRCRSRRFP